jgi:serine/threonine-protein kinase
VCWNCGITLAGVDYDTHPDATAYGGQAQHDPMIGRWVLDQYIVRSRIAEGGMGAVYLAEQPAIGRNAIIKIVHPWLGRDEKMARRFGAEARAAAKLQNPHIVSIYNYGKMADGTLFIAMEHLSGITLAELVASERRIEPARAVAIATQVCEALAEAHRRGVVHRDLKPTNIMLVRRGSGPDFVKVLDFGIAKLDGNEVTATGALVGTPRYMAPEQLQGHPVDGRADIYTLGLVLYEMLTGRPPFEADTPAAYMQMQLNQQPPPMVQACPGIDVPPALEACVMRALAKAPYQRPQSADGFADDLWSALMATVERANLPMPIVRPRGPSRGVVVVAVGVVVVGLLGAGVLAARTLRQSPPQDGDEAVVKPEVAVAVARPSTPTAEDFAGFGPPSAEKQALMRRSIVQLEKELEQVTLLSSLPRESIELSLAEYRAAIESPPRGVDPSAYRKELLAELVMRWRAVRATTPHPDRRLDELEAVFLTMHSSFDVHTRRRMLSELKKATAGAADPEAVVGRQLMEWIVTFSEDPDDVELEIIDE